MPCEQESATAKASRLYRFMVTQPNRATNAVYSQFYPAEFKVDGERFRWAEQWMMAAKARLFGDQEALAAILAADEPLVCKRIGRTVRNYDDERWSAARFDLVVEGNISDQRVS